MYEWCEGEKRVREYGDPQRLSEGSAGQVINYCHLPHWIFRSPRAPRPYFLSSIKPTKVIHPKP